MNRQDVMDHLQIIRTWAAVGKDPIYHGIEPKCCEDVEKWIDEALELLKEQEAVEPKSKVRHGANAQIQHFCGNCMTLLHGKPKYCSECGKKVYWRDRQ